MLRLMLAVALGAMSMAAAAQEIVLRHALHGAALDTLATLVVRFNDEQKGKAKVVMQDLGAVADRRQLPDLALLDPDDARLFFDTVPRFKPMSEVMKEGGQKFEAARFYPQIADAVDDLLGRPQALPMALALPVLFYSKEAFRKAGLDPDVPPKTWWEVQTAAGKLFDAGYKCPLTTSRFAWVHLENISSQSGEPMTVRNGRADHYVFNSLVHVKHVALLSSWYKSFYFHYFGPGREGDVKFVNGDCAMLTAESALWGELSGDLRFKVGVAELPYYEDVYGVRPANVLPDGAALWALPGRKKEQYKVMARFVDFLLRPQIQRDWVRATGFLPMTPAAIEAMQAAGVAPAVLDAARKRLAMPKQANARTKSNFGRNRVREILNEEIEFVWGNTKPAKEALDTAMRRVNEPAVAN